MTALLARVRREWGLLALLAFAFVYVAGGWTPSHYHEAARLLGLPHAGPTVGESRAIRSDEWAVTTPYFQIAVANDFGERDAASPYREPLKAFFALPSRDWSMVFKPDLWGFLVLDPAYAFSLHYALLAVAMIAGFSILLRQLGCSPGLALAAAVALFLSQFVQVWWTSNAAVLALAPWPVIAWLWRAPAWARGLAAFYAVAVWLISQLYPPFILGAGLALGVLVAAAKPQALRPAQLAPAVVGAVAGVVVAWLHYADLIPVMANTVYPGQRIAAGGGVAVLQLAAHIFPSLVTARFEPLELWPTNACEIGVVGSFLPLAIACFCDQRHALAAARQHWRAVAIWAAGLAIMAVWMLAPIPGRLAPGFNLIPPNRMIWAFGLLAFLGTALAAARLTWRLTALRVGSFCGLVAAGWAVSKLALSHTPLAFGRFDLIVILILALLIAARLVFRKALPPRRLVLLAVVLTAAVTFGRFNPIQSAAPIFHPGPSPIIEAYRAYAQANPKGWLVVPGVHGAVLNGAKLRAIDHTLLQPELAVFRRAYPSLSPAALNDTFNRYAHIAPSVRWAPVASQPDLILLPPDPFAIPLPVQTVQAATGNIETVVDQTEAEPLGPGRWGVTATGWAGWARVAPGQRLSVSLDPAVGRISSATAYRLPRADVVIARGDPALFAAGYGLRLEVEAAGDPRSALVIKAAQ